MANLKKVAIIGASAASCIYALFLKSKNYDVTIFEGSNDIGGEWGEDKSGAKYSNIIFPLSIKEKTIFRKSIIFLKKYGVKFKKNYHKTLFSKKVVNAKSCDLKGLYSLTKKKINIKKNFQVKSLFENKKFVLINNRYSFDYVFFPTYIKLNSLHIFKKNKKTKILIPFLKMNKALHLRVIISNLKKENYNFKNLTLGPLDRFQILNINKSLSQINGRVLLNWKNKKKKDIVNNIRQSVKFNKIISAKFFTYRSCIRDNKQIKILKNKLKETTKVRYMETFTLLEFLRVNIFNNTPLKKI